MSVNLWISNKMPLDRKQGARGMEQGVEMGCQEPGGSND